MARSIKTDRFGRVTKTEDGVSKTLGDTPGRSAEQRAEDYALAQEEFKLSHRDIKTGVTESVPEVEAEEDEETE